MEINNNIAFGSHRSILKTLWKKGLLPTVKRGFYGDILTRENVTLEHLSTFSRTHSSRFDNLVLASAAKNHTRGSEPLWKIIDIEHAKNYLKQFVDVHVSELFDGNKYISMITRKLKNLGIDIKKGIIKKRFKNQTKTRCRYRCAMRR